MRAKEFLNEKWQVPPLTLRQVNTLGIMALADYEDGASAYMRGDYGTALKKLKPLAEQGDADAQLWTGVMYKDGQGVSQDFEEALKWLSLSAEQEDAYAQYNLGEMHAKGLGVPQNHEIAVHWFGLAAKQGMARARFHLDLLNVYGHGVRQNYDTAIKPYTARC